MAEDRYRKLPINELAALHPDSPNFSKQVNELANQYEAWRDCRADGNCFYRAAGNAYLEYLCATNTPSAVLRSFYNNVYSQQFPIHDLNIVNEYRLFLKMLMGVCSFKENNSGYLQHVLKRLMLNEVFMCAYITVLRNLAFAGAIRHAKTGSDLYYEGMEEDLREITMFGHSTADMDMIGLGHALNCTVELVTIGRSDYQTTRTVLLSRRGGTLEIHLCLESGHYLTLYRR